MKRTLLFLFCALISTQMFSETLFGYLFPTLAYLERTSCHYMEGNEQNRTLNRLSFEDNMFEIDGNYYIEYNDMWLREDKEGRILVYSEPAKKDLVLYDFTLEIGDTLTTLNVDQVPMTEGDPILPGVKPVVVDYPIHLDEYVSFPIDTLIVTDVSMVMMCDSNQYKKWTFSNGMEYMEYIGNLGADFFAIIRNPWEELPTCCVEEDLVCASIYDRLVYLMDDEKRDLLNIDCPCTSWSNKWQWRTNTWNVLQFDGMAFEQTAQTWQYELAHDTIIGGKEYTAVTRHWTAYDESAAEYVAAVRFAENKKAFIYYDNAEYLLYDFGYHEFGDTLEVFSGINNYEHFKTYKCVITEKYTTSGIAEDTYVMDIIDPIMGNTIPAAMIWEEFVGSYSGFLHGGLLVPGNSNYQLLCAYKDNVLAYSVDNDAFTDNDTFIEYGCEYNAEQSPEDLFPTLWGLQRTDVELSTMEGYVDPYHLSFKEYTPTLVNGKLYLCDGRNYFREENNQVLLYAPYLGMEEDLVLYDWTLEVGDTLPFKPKRYTDEQLGMLFRVTDVSTIQLLDGKEYKKWTFSGGYEFVEGIGAINKGFGHFYCLRHTTHTGMSAGERLVCASRNGQLLIDNTEKWGVECQCEIETSYKSQWCDTWNVLELKYRYSSYTRKEDFETWRYYLAQDTIINNYTYTAVTRQTTKVPEGVYPFTIPEPEYVAAVRFTDDRKVYIYYDNTEYLLYDFNVQPGDELTVFAGINHYHSHHTNTIRVVEVERYPGIYPFGTEISLSVFPDFYGDVRPTCFGVTKWVEGVGDLCGFITGADCGLSEYQTALLCAYKDGNTEYTTEYEEYAEYGCEYNSGENKEYILTLPGLQRTEVEFHTDGAGAPALVSFNEYTPTLVNGKWYLYDGRNYLREENNQVLLYAPDAEIYEDIVLYDWTLEVGDTLPYHNKSVYRESDYIVTDVSTITLLDGKEYKKWTLACGYEYIEGIGAINGHGYGLFRCLSHYGHIDTYIQTSLVCASKNGQLLYQMDDAEMERLGAECLCEYNDGPRKDNAKDGKIGGRPTPTQWNMLEIVVREMENNKTILQAETFSYTLEDNSRILNNKTYFDLARQSTRDTAITKSVVGALHFSEDEGNRVYFLCDGMEYLLYDFTAEPGDSIEIFAGINNYPQATTYTHVVTSKDTLENGACRMILEVVFPNQTGGTNLQKVWLAGLGSLDGIVHNSAQRASNARSGETESSVMLCAWREDDCLYTTDHPEFDKVGCVYNLPTAVDDIQTPETQYQKIIHNGHLYILRNNKIYDVLGTPLN